MCATSNEENEGHRKKFTNNSLKQLISMNRHTNQRYINTIHMFIIVFDSFRLIIGIEVE